MTQPATSLKIMRSKVAMLQQTLEQIPEVLYVGDPTLRTPTENVELSQGIEIAEKLGEILLRYRALAGMGRGLAAPQIGLSKSVFVTFVDDQLQTFINPSLIEVSRTTNFYKELCLSCGILAADVERPEWIILQWTDVKGSRCTEKFSGFLARLYQHEEAHLRGIVNLDEALPKGIEFATFDPLQEKLRDVR